MILGNETAKPQEIASSLAASPLSVIEDLEMLFATVLAQQEDAREYLAPTAALEIELVLVEQLRAVAEARVAFRVHDAVTS